MRKLHVKSIHYSLLFLVACGAVVQKPFQFVARDIEESPEAAVSPNCQIQGFQTSSSATGALNVSEANPTGSHVVYLRSSCSFNPEEVILEDNARLPDIKIDEDLRLFCKVNVFSQSNILLFESEWDLCVGVDNPKLDQVFLIPIDHRVLKYLGRTISSAELRGANVVASFRGMFEDIDLSYGNKDDANYKIATSYDLVVQPPGVIVPEVSNSPGVDPSSSPGPTDSPGVVLPPQNLVLVTGNSMITLSWGAVPNASSYNVQRALSSAGPFANIANVSSTSYTNTGLSSGVRYYYRITAVSGGIESMPSIQTSGVPNPPTVSSPTPSSSPVVTSSPEPSPTPSVAPPTVVAIPQNLVLANGNGFVTLTWNSVAGASSYSLKRALSSGGPYSTIASTSNNYFTNTGLINGTTYYYRVTAMANGAESAMSNIAAGTPSAPPVSSPTPTPTPVPSPTPSP